MTDVLDRSTLDRATPARSKLTVIDCDIQRWVQYRKDLGVLLIWTNLSHPAHQRVRYLTQKILTAQTAF